MFLYDKLLWGLYSMRKINYFFHKKFSPAFQLQGENLKKEGDFVGEHIEVSPDIGNEYAELSKEHSFPLGLKSRFSLYSNDN